MKIPSNVIGGAGPHRLDELFPTMLPEPEKLVYQYVLEATQWRVDFPEDPGVPLTLPLQFSVKPRLAFFADRESDHKILVVRGWPAFPGKVPAIGVAIGNESEDAARELEGGGFAGDLYARDVATGEIVGTAAYYSMPLYSPVVVELIHENRDERDRLHEILKPTLFRLSRVLPGQDPQIAKVRVSSEKQELEGGPPVSEQPFVVYVSVFTVEVWYEVLEAVDVRGAEAIVGAIELTVDPAHTVKEPGIYTEAT